MMLSSRTAQRLNMITIIGPTASGKTALAAKLAYHLGSEVISADSRQVYQGMDIGTGKDLSDYVVTICTSISGIFILLFLISRVGGLRNPFCVEVQVSMWKAF